MGEDGNSIDFRAVLTNLAIVIGAPIHAPNYFEELTTTHKIIDEVSDPSFNDIIGKFYSWDRDEIDQEYTRIGKALRHLTDLDVFSEEECIKALYNWSRKGVP